MRPVIDWEELVERVEAGLTTGSDADAVRDLIDRVCELQSEIEHLNNVIAILTGSEAGCTCGSADAAGYPGSHPCLWCQKYGGSDDYSGG